MTKTASILSIGGFRRLTFLKPLAILLAMLMLPSELPFFGRFSLTPKADAQFLCGRQATIFQVCSPATNDFETEARSDYETQYNLKPGDGNLIYTYGRTDLRGSLRAIHVRQACRGHSQFAGEPDWGRERDDLLLPERGAAA